MSWVLITTRKQMYITLIVIALALVFKVFREEKIKDSIKRYLLTIGLMMSLIIIGNRVFEYAYSYYLYGEMGTHFNDNRFLTTVVFYVSELDDGQYIEDEAVRQVFEKIYVVCDSEESMMHSANGNLLSRTQHFENHYDMIQIDHMWPEFEEYAFAITTDGVGREAIVDEMSATIARSLIPHVWPKMIKVFLNNFLEGITNTIANVRLGVLYYYAIIMIILYCVILNVHSRKYGWTPVAMLGLLVFALLIINVISVAMLIFCQFRYMIYNMPLFYISFLIMIRELMVKRKADEMNTF